jgi:hypothetical protein
VPSCRCSPSTLYGTILVREKNNKHKKKKGYAALTALSPGETHALLRCCCSYYTHNLRVMEFRKKTQPNWRTYNWMIHVLYPRAANLLPTTSHHRLRLGVGQAAQGFSLCCLLCDNTSLPRCFMVGVIHASGISGGCRLISVARERGVRLSLRLGRVV